MNERKVENLKVFFRERPILYKMAQIAYLPVRVIEKLKKNARINKDVTEVLERMEQIDAEKKYVFYVGIPVCENLGDLAMMACIREWIGNNFEEYIAFELKTYPTYNKKVRDKLQNCVKPEDIFITQSGALFSNKHQDHGMHRYLLKNFPENRILFMPVTADLTEPGELLKTAELFNAHKKSLLLVRDRVSYQMVCEELDLGRVRLYPDIVTSMIGQVDTIRESERKGVLVCKRIDGEKYFTDKGIEGLLAFVKGQTERLDVTDMSFEQPYEYVMSHAKEIIVEKLNLFASYEVIITDRFHGMIYALISNTPVIALPTVGHKVREGAKWFNEYYPESVFFCETPEKAGEMVKELLERGNAVRNKSIFKELYYDKLSELFDEITLSTK